MGDLLLLVALYFTAATPVMWIVLFFLLRKSRSARIAFWISCSIYLLIAAIGFAMLSQASGWDGLGVVVIGGAVLGFYSFIALIVLLILRKNLNNG